MHTPNGGKPADRRIWFYGYNSVYCPLQVLLAVKLGENHFMVLNIVWRTGELGFTDIIGRLRSKSPKTGERCEPAGKLYNLSKTGFRRRLSGCRRHLQKSASTA
ncbi:MAG: hypothetical protein ACTTGZ_07200 [Treponema sp.]